MEESKNGTKYEEDDIKALEFITKEKGNDFVVARLGDDSPVFLYPNRTWETTNEILKRKGGNTMKTKTKLSDMEVTEVKQDSVTYGTAAKGGAIKVYFDLQTMKDEEVVKLISRAKELYNRSKIM